MIIIIYIYILLINTLTFITYGVDKYKAVKKKWRISENNLLLLILLGGYIGGVLGMIFFSHKTIKSSFQIKFRILVFVWIIISLGYVIW